MAKRREPEEATQAQIEAAAFIAVRSGNVGQYLTDHVMYFKRQSDIPRIQEAIARQKTGLSGGTSR